MLPDEVIVSVDTIIFITNYGGEVTLNIRIKEMITMFWCEECKSTDCCERTDLVEEPVLCDECYRKNIGTKKTRILNGEERENELV